MNKRTALAAAISCLCLLSCDARPAENTSAAVGYDENASLGNVSSAGTIFCDVVDRRISKEDCDDLKAIKGEVSQGAAAFNVPDPMQRGKSASIHLVVDRRSAEAIAALDAARAANDADNQADTNSDAAENAAAGPDQAEGNEAANPPRKIMHARFHRSHTNGPPGETLPPTPKQQVAPLPGRTETFVPSVGRFMSADLVGKGFTIVPVTPRSQEIPPGGQTSWEWSVTPLEGGPHSLTLKTVVEGEVGGKRYALGGTETTRKVEVRVTTIDRIADTLDGVPAWLKRFAAIVAGLSALIGAIWGLRRALKGQSAPAGDPPHHP